MEKENPIFLKIVFKYGHDISFQRDKTLFETLSTTYGENCALEKERFFFSRRCIIFQSNEIHGILVTPFCLNVKIGSNPDWEEFRWNEVLEAQFIGDNLGIYKEINAELETYLKSKRLDLCLKGSEFDYRYWDKSDHDKIVKKEKENPLTN